MKIFISWSGEQSRHIAGALRKWLPQIIQALDPWLSDEDIGAGARWSSEVSKALDESDFGILVVTADNVDKPWLNFEAGALAKSLEQARVCPYVYGMEPTDITPGPLTQFQAKRANRADTLKLIRDINDVLPGKKVEKESLNTQFGRFWDDLAAEIDDAPLVTAEPVRRSNDQILEEVVAISRRLDSELKEIKETIKSGRASLRPAGKGGVQLRDTTVIRELQDKVQKLAERAGIEPTDSGEVRD